MPGRQAKLISPQLLRQILSHVQCHSPNPARDRVIILLSVRAGLRTAEIAQLRWPMVLDASGRVADSLVITDHIAKKGGGRRIPLHEELRHALQALKHDVADRHGPVIASARGGALRPNSIANWFVALFNAWLRLCWPK